MSKNTKLFLINGNSEGWPKIFQEKLTQSNYTFESLDSRDMCIILERDNDVVFYEKGLKKDFLNSYVYIKHKRNDSYFIHLLSEYLNRKNIDFNDKSANLGSHFSANKTSQMIRMFLDGVRIPNSIICTQKSYEQNKDVILSHITFPCVAKRSGSKGKSVWKIESVQELEKIISLDPIEDTTLIQEFIPNSFDTRVFIFEDKIIAAIDRINDNGFHNNISQGGTGRKTTLTQEEQEACIKALKSSGLTFGGADMVKDKNGNVLFFEVNKVPQTEMFEGFAEVPIREKVVEEILKRYF